MGTTSTVAEAIAGALRRHGVATLFTQSLPTALVLACQDAGIGQFTYRTENAGGVMADAFARVTGRIPVVTAQNGPAATLLVPPLAEALRSSIPIVALVQEVNRSETDRNAFQELDHLALFAGCAKWVRRVTEPERVVDYVDMAFATAGSGRPGPAVLLLPADLLLDDCPPSEHRTADLGAFPLDRSVPSAPVLDEAAALLTAAAAPLVMAGGGVHLSGAAAELARLQDEAQLPVVTTVMGKGAVDERHALSLGVGGNLAGQGSLAARHQAIVGEADVVLLVGTRTAANGTDGWRAFAPGTRFIHVDADPTEIGRNYEALRLVGDARETLAALRARLAGARRRPDRLIERIAADRRDYLAETTRLRTSAARPIRPERLMADLDTVLTPETIVVADASYASVWISAHLTATEPGMRFLTPRGLAGLGWGLPMALGARHARPDRPVLAVVGDGGFGHVWAELETAARTGSAVVVTVLNNQVLGFQKDAEDVKFGRHTDACYFGPVDHAAIARACGCRGVRVEDPAEYLPAVVEALEHNGPTVIDVDTDPQAYPTITLFDDLDEIRSHRS